MRELKLVLRHLGIDPDEAVGKRIVLEVFDRYDEVPMMMTMTTMTMMMLMMVMRCVSILLSCHVRAVRSQQ